MAHAATTAVPPPSSSGAPRRAPAFLPLALILAATMALSGCAWFGGGYDLPPPGQGTVMDTARSQIGAPYCYGGESPQTGFDCSGFIQWVYARHGVNLPRRTWDLIETGYYVPRGKQKPGDLVFFNVSQKKTSLHVGIVSGRESFIHSPSSGGVVREDRMANPYWRNTYIQTRRVIE